MEGRAIDALADDEEAFHHLALQGLEKYGAESADAVPRLVEWLESGCKGRDLSQLLRTLVAIGPAAAAAVPEVEKLHGHEKWLVRCLAYETLKAIRDEPGAPAE